MFELYLSTFKQKMLYYVQSVHLQLDQLLPVDFHLHAVTEQFQQYLTREAEVHEATGQ